MHKILFIAYTTWMEMWRRKAFYVLGILLAAMLLLLVSINLTGLGSISGYAKDIGLLCIWILGWILGINLAVRQLPQEEKRGTIYAVLARPVSRLNLVLGKWLGAWGATAMAILCFYAVTILILAFFGGAFDPLTLLQAATLHIMLLAMITAIAIAFSTRLSHEAAATLSYVTTGAAFAFVPKLPEWINESEGWNEYALLFFYNALPHVDLFDMRRRTIHLHGTIPWHAWSLILLYGAVMTSIFLLLAWLAYRRKHFSRTMKD